MASGYLLNHIKHLKLRGFKHPHISDIDKETWIELVFYICLLIIVLSIWR